MKTQSEIPQSGETIRRSLVKTISYRVIIITLDFIAVYLFTRKIEIAAGFTIVSNIYTTMGYFLFERIWNKIRWGKLVYKAELLKKDI